MICDSLQSYSTWGVSQGFSALRKAVIEHVLLKCYNFTVTILMMECLILFLTLYLNLLAYGQNIFGSFSEVYGNFR